MDAASASTRSPSAITAPRARTQLLWSYPRLGLAPRRWRPKPRRAASQTAAQGDIVTLRSPDVILTTGWDAPMSPKTQRWSVRAVGPHLPTVVNVPIRHGLTFPGRTIFLSSPCPSANSKSIHPCTQA